MLKFDKKYFIFTVCFLICYLIGYLTIENLHPNHYHLIATSIDYKIPFNEWFIFFYYAWFPYMAFSYLYLFFKDKKQFLKLITFTFIAMALFIFISIIFPNQLDIRPTYLNNDNIAKVLVNIIHKADTPTNVLPSIHVYNSIGFMIALMKTKTLNKSKILSNILAIGIILSTMFVKQHGIIDVVSAIVLALILYYVVYVKDIYFFKNDYNKRYGSSL